MVQHAQPSTKLVVTCLLARSSAVLLGNVVLNHPRAVEEHAAANGVELLIAAAYSH